MPSTASSTPGGGVASVAPGARRREPGEGPLVAGVGEGDGEQPALAPGDAAAPDRRVEQRHARLRRSHLGSVNDGERTFREVILGGVTAAEEQILRRARAVPAGFVASYGDLSPGAPRAAGRALAVCEDAGVPWHRIVRADGSLAKGARQRRLLEAEGVPFSGRRVRMDLVRVPAEALDQLAAAERSD